MKMHKFTVKVGQEVMETIEKKCSENNINEGAIVSLIGAVDECAIINMNKDNAKEDIVTEYNEPFEMSGSGEIKEGKPHIHAVFGKQGDQTLSGHFVWGKVKTWFVNVYILAE